MVFNWLLYLRMKLDYIPGIFYMVIRCCWLAEKVYSKVKSDLYNQF